MAVPSTTHGRPALPEDFAVFFGDFGAEVFVHGCERNQGSMLKLEAVARQENVFRARWKRQPLKRLRSWTAISKSARCSIHFPVRHHGFSRSSSIFPSRTVRMTPLTGSTEERSCLLSAFSPARLFHRGQTWNRPRRPPCPPGQFGPFSPSEECALNEHREAIDSRPAQAAEIEAQHLVR